MSYLIKNKKTDKIVSNWFIDWGGKINYVYYGLYGIRFSCFNDAKKMCERLGRGFEVIEVQS